MPTAMISHTALLTTRRLAQTDRLTAKGLSGPLWVHGGIGVIGADGFAYEVRNRVALCRCGASRNKPFCDGSHVSTGFNDKD
jgi:hypothetical protein